MSYRGLPFYLNIPLHRKFLSDPNNVIDLENKVDELMELYFTREKVESLRDHYLEIALPILSESPDVLHTRFTPDEIEFELEYIYSLFVRNVDVFKENLEFPAPVFMSFPQIFGNEYQVWWNESFDFQGDDFHYIFQISKDAEFNEIIFHKEQTALGISFSIENLQPGIYYYRVLIEDEFVHIQTNAEYYINPETGNTLYHSLYFEIGGE